MVVHIDLLSVIKSYIHTHSDIEEDPPFCLFQNVTTSPSTTRTGSSTSDHKPITHNNILATSRYQACPLTTFDDFKSNFTYNNNNNTSINSDNNTIHQHYRQNNNASPVLSTNTTASSFLNNLLNNSRHNSCRSPQDASPPTCRSSSPLTISSGGTVLSLLQGNRLITSLNPGSLPLLTNNTNSQGTPILEDNQISRLSQVASDLVTALPMPMPKRDSLPNKKKMATELEVRLIQYYLVYLFITISQAW